MSNGQVPDWNNWQNLTSEQREFEQHRVLVNLDNRLACVEKRKKWDTVTSGFMGLVGGFAGMLGLRAFIK